MTQTFTFLSLTKTTISAFTITKRDESLIETCFDSCLSLPVKNGAKICASDQCSRAESAVSKARFKWNLGWITYKIKISKVFQMKRNRQLGHFFCTWNTGTALLPELISFQGVLYFFYKEDLELLNT